MNEAVVPSGASLLRSPRPSPAMRVRAKRPAPPIGVAGAGAFTVPYPSQPDPRLHRSARHPWRRVQFRPRRVGQGPCVRSARAIACANQPRVQGRSPAAMRVGHPRALSAAGRLFVNGPDAQRDGDKAQFPDVVYRSRRREPAPGRRLGMRFRRVLAPFPPGNRRFSRFEAVSKPPAHAWWRRIYAVRRPRSGQ